LKDRDDCGRAARPVSRRQLLAAGIAPGVITGLLRRGVIFRIHAGVYAVGHLAPVALGRETAALLAIRDAAVLSHDSAAMLWGRTPPGSGNGLVHVLVNGPAPAAARWAFACTAPAASIPGTAAFTSAFPSPRPRGRCWTSPRI